MPRKARIDYPGALHHVIVRGIEKKYIFKEAKEKEEFYSRLKFYLTKSNMFCYAWCIMGNHVHLLLQSGNAGLGKFMNQLLTSYAVYYNKLKDRVGYLFQNRYKSILCDKDEYLLSLIRYVNLNPVRAKIIDINQLENYKWASYREIINGKDVIVERDEILGYYAKEEKNAVKKIREFIKEGIDLKENYEGGGLKRSAGGLAKLLKRTVEEREIYDERILGCGNFVEDVLAKVKDEEQDKRRFKIKNIEDLLNKVITMYELTSVEMLKTRIRKAREAKSLFVYIGNVYLGKSYVELGRILGMTDYGAKKAMLRGEKLIDSGEIMLEKFN